MGEASAGILLTTSQMQSLEDFYVMRELGEGSFSTVFLVSAKANHEKFALKVVSKKKVLREKKTKSVFREKEALKALSTAQLARPFILQLFCTFHDDSSLYFVTSWAENGDLAEKLAKEHHFNLETSRFVVAEMITAIAFCHAHGFLHRDIKPQNLLVRADFHLMLCDFGECISLEDNEAAKRADCKRKCSFVGSHLYVSPEVLRGDALDETCDYFAVGSILFECLSGRAPFQDASEHLVFQRVVKGLFSFPSDFPADAKTLVQGLLANKQDQRLGSTAQGGADALKRHAFFLGLDWDGLFDQPSPLARFYRAEVGEPSAAGPSADPLQAF